MNRIRIAFFSFIFVFYFFSAALSQEKLNFDSRVKELVSKMTLEEKCSQLNTDYISSIPRLNIPKYKWHNEALHGLVWYNVTVFPTAIALAATFNEPLMLRIASAISDEGRVMFRRGEMGLNYFSPNLDIARDPRWGRCQETYGEDPYLASRMGVAYVKGMQGDDENYLKTITSPKHFAVHSGPESMRFFMNPQATQRDVWETYMPPFKAAVEEGGSYSIMCGYNAYQGVPMSVNKYLITDVVRNMWGLRGYVMNDCGGLSMARWNYGYGANEMETSALAIKAGLDLECGEYYYYRLKDACEAGLVSEELIDSAVFRVFKARFELGLFDPEEAVPYNAIPDSIVECAEHKELALRAARESMVLLKNENVFLPLNNDYDSIYVVGPNANQYWEMLGAYHGYPTEWTSFYEALRKRLDSNFTIKHDKCLEINGMMTEFADSKHFKTPDGKPGLLGEYFDNPDLEGEPVFTRIDTAIDFHWLRDPPIEELPDGAAFSVRWTGTIRLDKGGNYTFSVISNDGARLWINDRKIVDSWWEHGAVPFIGFDTLAPNVEYPFKLEYFFTQSWSHVRLEFGGDSTGEELYQAIAEKAKNSDLIIFVGGLSTVLEGEMFDRPTLEIPEGQKRLLNALEKTGVPIVFVVYAGSVVALEWVEKSENIPAVLLAWYGGQDAGIAATDILYGDCNPSGRLPITFVKSDDDLPDFANYFMEGRTYRYFRGEPLYPFGYGLSYTSFEYDDLILPKEKIDISQTDTIDVIFNLTNTGDMDGDEVAQLYVVNLTSKVPQPIKQLKGFSRRNLESGETIKDTIKLAINELYYYDSIRCENVVEPGLYEIQIGASSADVRLNGVIELYDSTINAFEPIEPVEPTIVIYPNPSRNFIFVKGYSGEIAIYNSIGGKIFCRDIYNYERIDLSRLKPGIYVIRCGDKMKKFVKL